MADEKSRGLWGNTHNSHGRKVKVYIPDNNKLIQSSRETVGGKRIMMNFYENGKGKVTARPADKKKEIAKKMNSKMFKQSVNKRKSDYESGKMAEKDRESYRTSHLINRK